MKIEMRSKKDIKKCEDMSTYDRAVYMLSEETHPRDIGKEELVGALARALVQAGLYDGDARDVLYGRVMGELRHQRWSPEGGTRYDWDYFCDPNFMYRVQVGEEFRDVRTHVSRIVSDEEMTRDEVWRWFDVSDLESDESLLLSLDNLSRKAGLDLGGAI